MKRPTKAIICAAGLGTRFLPQTKAMPKEMLPIIDKPVIQLIVEEAVAAGVTEVIIVTGSTKRPIEDHFDRADELENELEQRGKKELAQKLREVAEMANFIYLRQKGSPKGNALPVLNARHLISNDEPFFVFFADDFFKSEVPRAAQLLDAYKKTGKSVMSFAEVAPEKADQYGIAKPGEYKEEDLFTVKGLVEKPELGTEPSLLAQTGCYLLTPDILPLIENLQPGKGGEIVLGDSISQLAEKDVVYGKKISGTWHDGGNPLGYIKAVIDFALDSDEYKEELSRYLKNRV